MQICALKLKLKEWNTWRALNSSFKFLWRTFWRFLVNAALPCPFHCKSWLKYPQKTKSSQNLSQLTFYCQYRLNEPNKQTNMTLIHKNLFYIKNLLPHLNISFGCRLIIHVQHPFLCHINLSQQIKKLPFFGFFPILF